MNISQNFFYVALFTLISTNSYSCPLEYFQIIISFCCRSQNISDTATEPTTNIFHIVDTPSARSIIRTRFGETQETTPVSQKERHAPSLTLPEARQSNADVTNKQSPPSRFNFGQMILPGIPMVESYEIIDQDSDLNLSKIKQQ